jgi:hypothetical protein
MKRASLVLIFLTVVFGGGWLARSMMMPAYPIHWDALELGMTPAEAKATVPGLDPCLREMKGFDQAGLDLGDRYWNLLVSYDGDGRVCEITKNYVDRRNGFFNRSLVESKL